MFQIGRLLKVFESLFKTCSQINQTNLSSFSSFLNVLSLRTRISGWEKRELPFYHSAIHVTGIIIFIYILSNSVMFSNSTSEEFGTPCLPKDIRWSSPTVATVLSHQQFAVIQLLGICAVFQKVMEPHGSLPVNKEAKRVFLKNRDPPKSQFGFWVVDYYAIQLNCF